MTPTVSIDSGVDNVAAAEAERATEIAGPGTWTTMSSRDHAGSTEGTRAGAGVQIKIERGDTDGMRGLAAEVQIGFTENGAEAEIGGGTVMRTVADLPTDGGATVPTGGAGVETATEQAQKMRAFGITNHYHQRTQRYFTQDSEDLISQM